MVLSLKTKISFIGLACFMNACTPTINNHGYEETNIDFSKIIPGLNEQDVLQKLGSPSTISSFAPQVWYYIMKTTETKAFFKPKLLEQRVFVVKFNEKGIVTSAGETNKADFKEIAPNKTITPTSGYETNVFKEIFSNFGRISSKSSSK